MLSQTIIHCKRQIFLVIIFFVGTFLVAVEHMTWGVDYAGAPIVADVLSFSAIRKLLNLFFEVICQRG